MDSLVHPFVSAGGQAAPLCASDFRPPCPAQFTVRARERTFAVVLRWDAAVAAGRFEQPDGEAVPHLEREPIHQELPPLESCSVRVVFGAGGSVVRSGAELLSW